MVGESLGVEWHAGEPLVLPTIYYERAIETIRGLNRNDVQLDFTVQTNATLIDKDWCALFKRHAFRIGVSVDGPARFHDSRRRDWTGSGTHQRVMRGIKTLQDAGIKFGVITVLTADALEYPDEIYEFYASNGISAVGFNPEEVEGVNKSTSLDSDDAESRFRSFMLRLLELQRTSAIKVQFRELLMMAGQIRFGHGERAPDAEPFALVTVDWDGNFSTFSPEMLGIPNEQYSGFVLGNVRSTPLATAERLPLFKRIATDIDRGLEECRRTCPYFQVCGGGSPSNKLGELGRLDGTETRMCRLRQKVVADLLMDDIECVLGINA
jgi:uncharacterized protein